VWIGLHSITGVPPLGAMENADDIRNAAALAVASACVERVQLDREEGRKKESPRKFPPPVLRAVILIQACLRRRAFLKSFGCVAELDEELAELAPPPPLVAVTLYMCRRYRNPQWVDVLGEATLVAGITAAKEVISMDMVSDVVNFYDGTVPDDHMSVIILKERLDKLVVDAYEKLQERLAACSTPVAVHTVVDEGRREFKVPSHLERRAFACADLRMAQVMEEAEREVRLMISKSVTTLEYKATSVRLETLFGPVDTPVREELEVAALRRVQFLENEIETRWSRPFAGPLPPHTRAARRYKLELGMHNPTVQAFLQDEREHAAALEAAFEVRVSELQGTIRGLTVKRKEAKARSVIQDLEERLSDAAHAVRHCIETALIQLGADNQKVTKRARVLLSVEAHAATYAMHAERTAEELRAELESGDASPEAADRRRGIAADLAATLAILSPEHEMQDRIRKEFDEELTTAPSPAALSAVAWGEPPGEVHCAARGQAPVAADKGGYPQPTVSGQERPLAPLAVASRDLGLQGRTGTFEAAAVRPHTPPSPTPSEQEPEGEDNWGIPPGFERVIAKDDVVVRRPKWDLPQVQSPEEIGEGAGWDIRLDPMSLDTLQRFDGQPQEEALGPQVVTALLTLKDLTMDVVKLHTEAVFATKFCRAIADAVGVQRERIHVVSFAPGSVKMTMTILEPGPNEQPIATAFPTRGKGGPMVPKTAGGVLDDLTKQLDDPSSKLRLGEVGPFVSNATVERTVDSASQKVVQGSLATAYVASPLTTEPAAAGEPLKAAGTRSFAWTGSTAAPSTEFGGAATRSAFDTADKFGSSTWGGVVGEDASPTAFSGTASDQKFRTTSQNPDQPTAFQKAGEAWSQPYYKQPAYAFYDRSPEEVHPTRDFNDLDPSNQKAAKQKFSLHASFSLTRHPIRGVAGLKGFQMPQSPTIAAAASWLDAEEAKLQEPPTSGDVAAKDWPDFGEMGKGQEACEAALAAKEDVTNPATPKSPTQSPGSRKGGKKGLRRPEVVPPLEPGAEPEPEAGLPSPGSPQASLDGGGVTPSDVPPKKKGGRKRDASNDSGGAAGISPRNPVCSPASAGEVSKGHGGKQGKKGPALVEAVIEEVSDSADETPKTDAKKGKEGKAKARPGRGKLKVTVKEGHEKIEVGGNVPSGQPSPWGPDKKAICGDSDGEDKRSPHVGSARRGRSSPVEAQRPTVWDGVGQPAASPKLFAKTPGRRGSHPLTRPLSEGDKPSPELPAKGSWFEGQVDGSCRWAGMLSGMHDTGLRHQVDGNDRLPILVEKTSALADELRSPAYVMAAYRHAAVKIGPPYKTKESEEFQECPQWTAMMTLDATLDKNDWDRAYSKALRQGRGAKLGPSQSVRNLGRAASTGKTSLPPVRRPPRPARREPRGMRHTDSAPGGLGLGSHLQHHHAPGDGGDGDGGRRSSEGRRPVDTRTPSVRISQVMDPAKDEEYDRPASGVAVADAIDLGDLQATEQAVPGAASEQQPEEPTDAEKEEPPKQGGSKTKKRPKLRERQEEKPQNDDADEKAAAEKAAEKAAAKDRKQKAKERKREENTSKAKDKISKDREDKKAKEQARIDAEKQAEEDAKAQAEKDEKAREEMRELAKNPDAVVGGQPSGPRKPKQRERGVAPPGMDGQLDMSKLDEVLGDARRHITAPEEPGASASEKPSSAARSDKPSSSSDGKKGGKKAKGKAKERAKSKEKAKEPQKQSSRAPREKEEVEEGLVVETTVAESEASEVERSEAAAAKQAEEELLASTIGEYVRNTSARSHTIAEARQAKAAAERFVKVTITNVEGHISSMRVPVGETIPENDSTVTWTRPNSQQTVATDGFGTLVADPIDVSALTSGPAQAIDRSQQHCGPRVEEENASVADEDAVRASSAAQMPSDHGVGHIGVGSPVDSRRQSRGSEAGHGTQRSRSGSQADVTAVVEPPFAGEKEAEQGNENMVQPGVTVLVEDVEIGAKKLEVNHIVGFAHGNVVRINPGGATEEDKVIEAFGSIIVAEPLFFDHRVGEVVKKWRDRAAPETKAAAGDSLTVDFPIHEQKQHEELPTPLITTPKAAESGSRKSSKSCSDRASRTPSLTEEVPNHDQMQREEVSTPLITTPKEGEGGSRNSSKSCSDRASRTPSLTEEVPNHDQMQREEVSTPLITTPKEGEGGSRNSSKSFSDMVSRKPSLTLEVPNHDQMQREEVWTPVITSPSVASWLYALPRSRLFDPASRVDAGAGSDVGATAVAEPTHEVHGDFHTSPTEPLSGEEVSPCAGNSQGPRAEEPRVEPAAPEPLVVEPATEESAAAGSVASLPPAAEPLAVEPPAAEPAAAPELLTADARPPASQDVGAAVADAIDVQALAHKAEEEKRLAEDDTGLAKEEKRLADERISRKTSNLLAAPYTRLLTRRVAAKLEAAATVDAVEAEPLATVAAVEEEEEQPVVHPAQTVAPTQLTRTLMPTRMRTNTGATMEEVSMFAQSLTSSIFRKSNKAVLQRASGTSPPRPALGVGIGRSLQVRGSSSISPPPPRSESVPQLRDVPARSSLPKQRLGPAIDIS